MAVEVGKAGLSGLSKRCKAGLDVQSELAAKATGAGSQNLPTLLEFKGLIFIRYLDHVLYHRSMALAMAPQTRDAVGWLVYECDQYIVLVWDRDAGPPTLKGGDPKASGLVLLRSDIVEFKRLDEFLPLQNSLECTLNCQGALNQGRVCAFSQRSEKLPIVQKRSKPL